MEPSTPEMGSTSLGDRDRAREAWGLGLAAIVLSVFASCAPISLLAALPLGWIAMSRARAILQNEPDGITEVYARTARITGTVALVWSCFYIGGIIVIIAGYGAVLLAVLSQIPSTPGTP
ncbi:MAG: hypothetical protein AAGA48_16785 [Myxococcota bacterium]